ncbi:MAG TPA: hypothetical protein VLH84_01565 [Patescibacteria group bacterium]|nr:hypothetical protein [Patescibacteria group bacterium]
MAEQPYVFPGVTDAQLAQYPNLQTVGNMNGLQAGQAVEMANRINDARDIAQRHPDSDHTVLQQEIDDATARIDMYLGGAATQNYALRPQEPAPAEPEAETSHSSAPGPMMVVSGDGRIVPYGQIRRGDHPQEGRIVSGGYR